MFDQDVGRRPHPGDNRRHVGLRQNEAQRHFGHGHPARTSGFRRVGALYAVLEVFGDEIGVPPIALGPATSLRQRAGQRALVEGDAGDHRDACSRQSGEQFVLGGLVEDVVDDLDGVDQAGAQRAQDRWPAPSG